MAGIAEGLRGRLLHVREGERLDARIRAFELIERGIFGPLDG